MPTVSLSSPSILQFLNNSGQPNAGGTLLTQVGGVNVATYQDAAGTISLPNPIPLNARGEVSNAAGVSCQLFLMANSTYTFTLFDPIGNQINQAASVSGPNNLSLITNLAASSGSSLVGYTQGGTGAITRTAQDKLRESVSAFDFMTTAQIADVQAGTTTLDVSAALQAAINSLGNAGGTVLFPAGIYKISLPLNASVGVLFKSKQLVDLSSNTNGSGASSTMIRWAGGVFSGYMYTIAPVTIGTLIWGGGSVGIEWDGSSAATGAVHLNNTKGAVFNGKVRSVTYAGVFVSSINGSPSVFSQQNHIQRLEFVYGVAAACDNANACVFTGNGSTVPGTQQMVGVIFGLVKNGYGLVISETDNCKVDFVTIATIGTGGALLLNNVGFGPSNSNKFYKVSGKINCATNLYGNEIAFYGSEGGGIIGSGTWDGEIEDYVTGRKFKSHVYQMRKWIDFKAGDFMGDAATGVIKAGLQWQTLTFPKVGNPLAAAFLSADYDLANGAITGLDFFYTTNGSAAGNLVMAFRLSTVAVGGSLVTPKHSFQPTITQASQYLIAKYSYNLVPALSFSRGDTIALSVQRIGGNALDTATDEVQLIGVRLNYASTGPDSSGSGTYFIPAWD